MSDRLEEIKKLSQNVPYLSGYGDDIAWLIAEVERLQKKLAASEKALLDHMFGEDQHKNELCEKLATSEKARKELVLHEGGRGYDVGYKDGFTLGLKERR